MSAKGSLMTYANDMVGIVTEHQRRAGNTVPLFPDHTPAPDVPAQISLLIDGLERFVIQTDREIFIGRRARPRDPEVTVDLTDYGAHSMGVSRVHAMITTTKGRLTVQDLNSVNGTLINGRVALPLQRYVLQDGDTITLGALVIQVAFQNI